MNTSYSLLGGQVLRPDGGLEIAEVHIADGRIVETPTAGAERIDCRGYQVLPGIVDIHGDAFELELYPRPGVEIPFPIAMGSVDRQLLSNGITTAFHGLTVSWEPGARGLPAARRFMEGLGAARARLLADHRVQLRWETFAHEAIGDIAAWLAAEPAPAIAFNDHTTETLETVKAGDRNTLDKWARRAGTDLESYVAAAEAARQNAPDVPAKVREVAGLARRHGAPMLAHDEASPAERAANRALGMRVSEFPLAPEVAAEAIAQGEHAVMGGPNVLRGGSHKGHMSAEDAVRGGLCNIVASDYYYPSLLHGAERLVARGVLALPGAWDLISRNPAAAMGLADRGTIEPGNRADLAVLDSNGPWRLVHTFAGGTPVSFGR